MISRLIYAILHPSLHKIEHPDYKRATIFAKGLLISFTADMIYAIYFYFHNPTDFKNISNVIGLSILSITTALLRFQSNFRLTVIFVISCILPLIAWGVSFTGGIYSTNLIWFIVISLSVYLYIGRTVGFYFSIFCFLVYILFLISAYFPEYNNYYLSFLQIQNPVDSFFNIAFSSLFCFIMIFAFVKALEDVNLQIKKVNDEKMETLNNRLKEKTEEISALRGTLARDFHDEMGNKLAGINVLSQMLVKKLKDSSDKETIEVLETIQQRSDELFVGTKDFIWSIDFKSDYVFYLLQYVQDFGEDFFAKLNISFRFNSQNYTDSKLRLNISSGRQTVSILKEAMTNIAKHAQATEVVFDIKVNENTLKISLTDNGKGFDVEKVRKNGLLNMQERTSQMGAKFSIISEINSKTEILLLIPLEIS